MRRLGRSSACIWRVRAFSHTSCHLSVIRAFVELQGHAIKNQDLLMASGAISLKGSEGMTAVDDDLAAAVRPHPIS